MNLTDRAQYQVTVSMINMYGVDISIIRPSAGWETTASGGQRRSQADVDAMPAVRRYFQNVDADVIMGSEDQGDRALVHAILIGLPGDDIEKSDQFVGPDGLTYEVRQVVFQTKAFETRAECFAYAN